MNPSPVDPATPLSATQRQHSRKPGTPTNQQRDRAPYQNHQPEGYVMNQPAGKHRTTSTPTCTDLHIEASQVNVIRLASGGAFITLTDADCDTVIGVRLDANGATTLRKTLGCSSWADRQVEPS